MKLKYFLLILPILFWVGCEDNNDNDDALTSTSLAGTWNISAACISPDPDGCDTCEEAPLGECDCENGDETCFILTL